MAIGTIYIEVDGEWVEGEPVVGDLYREQISETLEDGRYSYIEAIYSEPVEEVIIDVGMTLSTTQCAVGEAVTCDITFSEPLTIEEVLPISITDRNGNHVTNIGCMVTDGASTTTFTMENAGDFTVTDEAINFHRNAIDATLRLTEQPWLRVYQ